jgi:hypothetical protein
MAVGLEMLAGTPRPVGENQAEKKASHRDHRGHREGMAVGPKVLAGTPEACGREPGERKKQVQPLGAAH